MDPSPQISQRSLVRALSAALDFTARGISDHHRRVAYSALRIGKLVGLGPRELESLYYAASLHDIGAITFAEKQRLSEFEVQQPNEHCERGRDFLLQSSLFAPLAEVVRCHHDRFALENASGRRGAAIPLHSRILHVADRVDVLTDPDRPILVQRRELIRSLRMLSGQLFDPVIVEAFCDASLSESFWLDLASGNPEILLDRTVEAWSDDRLGPNGALDAARTFARVIDSKSRFTSRHSRFVAAVAAALGARIGMPPADQSSLEIAGLLHDLGKLAVPEDILEKPSALNDDEFELIKQHPYYTYAILDRVEGIGRVRDWAAYHHERINGTGYPFRIGGDRLPLGARVMSVADIFSALVEDRPYRAGMEKPEVEKIMSASARSGHISDELVAAVLDGFDDLKALAPEGPLAHAPNRGASAPAPRDRRREGRIELR